MATMEVPAMSRAVPLNSSAGEDVASKTFHVSLRFRRLGNSKKVNASQYQIEADKALIRVSKKLLDAPELKAIGTADGEFKKWVDGICLPFDTGVRLVPKPAAEMLCAKAREFQTKRRLLVECFLAVYEAEIERARTRLGPLFNAKDYPPADWVKDQFSFSYQLLNFGVPSELANINPDIFEEEREKNARIFEEAVSLGQTMLLTTFSQMVERLKTQLEPTEDGKKRKLYDTAVTNLQEFISTFNLRNVSNYGELAAQVERAKEAVANLNTDKIRESDTLRQFVTQEMGQIEKSLQGLISTRTRKMRIGEEVLQ